MIRLHLSTGPVVKFDNFIDLFDNFIDLFDYMIERMTKRGEL
ncbi:hypothetical protein EDF56_106355 [Novosphingobium sp. PhB165]|nr:hypothetical protein [Novosphingobium sp. PhB165]TCM17239.1 hypothetical protein EDF56_106355 [Novosphingobium sp. PhB165]